MSNRGLGFFMLMLPALLGMRDPFAPVEDKCQTAQLTQWHYRGVIHQGKRTIGIMLRDDDKWQRVEQGKVIYATWRVSSVTSSTLQVEIGRDCEVANWQWQREATVYDKKDSLAPIGDHPADE